MSKLLRKNQSRIKIHSHQLLLPKYDLNMVLTKDHAMQVIGLVLELKAKEEAKS
jgi:hypothetical protein